MELLQAMRTTFAAREFTSDPVPDEVLYRILDNARFAPSGGNRQGWKVIVVRDPATRAALADLMVPAVKRYAAQAAAGESPWNAVRPTSVSDETIAATAAPGALLEPMVKAPVVLVVCVDLGVVASMDQLLDRVGVTSGGSIYPFAWSILLAARDEGLGGVLTTLITASEPEAKALLGLPDGIAVAGVLPIGKPVKQLTRLRRKPVEEFAMRERWGGSPVAQ